MGLFCCCERREPIGNDDAWRTYERNDNLRPPVRQSSNWRASGDNNLRSRGNGNPWR